MNHDPAHNFRLEDKHANQYGYSAKEREQETPESASVESNQPSQTVFVCDYCDSDIVGIRHTCGACPGTCAYAENIKAGQPTNQCLTRF